MPGEREETAPPAGVTVRVERRDAEAVLADEVERDPLPGLRRVDRVRDDRRVRVAVHVDEARGEVQPRDVQDFGAVGRGGLLRRRTGVRARARGRHRDDAITLDRDVGRYGVAGGAVDQAATEEEHRRHAVDQ